MILAGDIGGTHTRIAFFDENSERLRLVVEQIYQSREHASLGEIVGRFVGDQKIKVTSACFGLPGPVVHGRVVTSNLPWVVDAAELSKQLGSKRSLAESTIWRLMPPALMTSTPRI